MIKLNDRIAFLKNATTNENVLDILNKAVTACNSAETLNLFVSEALVSDLTQFDADPAVKKFVQREMKLIAINKLGIKEALDYLSNSEFMQVPTMKQKIMSYSNTVTKLPEYYIATNFINEFANSWDKNIAMLVETVQKNFTSCSEDIHLMMFINEYVSVNGSYLKKMFAEEFDTYFINRDAISKKILLEKISPLKSDAMVQKLANYLIETDSNFNAISNNVAIVKNIHSPVIVNEREKFQIFYSSGNFMLKNTDGISILPVDAVAQLPKDFISLAQFIDSPSVKVMNEKILVYTTNKKVEIVKENADVVIYLNNKKTSKNVFARFFMNEGIFNQGENEILNKILLLVENFDKIYEIDYGRKIQSKLFEGRFVDIFKCNETIYINKIDLYNNKQDFYSSLNATQSSNLILEYIGYDIKESFRDYLPKEIETINTYKSNIKVLRESIDDLTAKRNDVEKTINESVLYRNDIRLNDLHKLLSNEIQILKEKELITKNALDQFQSVGLNLLESSEETEAAETSETSEGSNEENAIDTFWKNSSNRTKVLYFIQFDEENSTWIIGSQDFKQYQDSFYWEVLGTDDKKVDAEKQMQKLMNADKNGVFFETDDYKNLSEKNAETEKLEKNDDTVLSIGDKIQMKNEKYGVVTSIDDATGALIISMEDGKNVSVPQEKSNELKLVEKKSKLSTTEIQPTGDGQSVQIRENEWVNGTITDDKGNKKSIKVNSLDYTKNAKGDKVRIQDNGKTIEVFKNAIELI
jgi:hypothetical protein